VQQDGSKKGTDNMADLLTNIIVSCITTTIVAVATVPPGARWTNLQQTVTYYSTNGTSRAIMKLHGSHDWWIVDSIDTNYPVILKR
jgi:hypothetical protein